MLEYLLSLNLGKDIYKIKYEQYILKINSVFKFMLCSFAVMEFTEEFSVREILYLIELSLRRPEFLFLFLLFKTNNTKIHKQNYYVKEFDVLCVMQYC